MAAAATPPRALFLMLYYYLTSTIVIAQFPFTQGHMNSSTCGGLFFLNCTLSPPQIHLGPPPGGVSLQILTVKAPNKILVLDPALAKHEKCHRLRSPPYNTTAADHYPPLSTFAIHPNISFLSCPKRHLLSDVFVDQHLSDCNSYTGCGDFDLYYEDLWSYHGLGCRVLKKEPDHIVVVLQNCSFVHLPLVEPPLAHEYGSDDLLQQLTPEYELEWPVTPGCAPSCQDQDGGGGGGGGMCLVNVTTQEISIAKILTSLFADASNAICYYLLLLLNLLGKRHRKLSSPWIILVLVLCAGVAFLGLLCFLVSFLIRGRNNKSNGAYLLSRSITRFRNEKAESQNAIEQFLNNNGNLALQRYKFSDLKKMTNSFAHELGKGGFGCVYKGKSPNDGRLVAVKILSVVTGIGEGFINEVASISRCSHVNIVTLLGYCFEGCKRALIYEFMPNGSLDKFIQNNAASPSAACRLGWYKLLDIAIGTARGLEYLHLGCNMKILHFDIKPHNILLDKDFNPKISDFGLAKLCPNRSSLVSMLVARGTIGYIAPEVFCRNFGRVSQKSDVYSYGMMILEMVVGKQNPDNQVDHSSEMYFPDWIYKHLETNSQVRFLDKNMNDDEWQLAKKMIIVGLWCIQTEPKNRPAMNKVVEMLVGDLDHLKIPPMANCASLPNPDALDAHTLPFEISTI